MGLTSTASTSRASFQKTVRGRRGASYRESVCRTPERIDVGPPFYEPFKIPAMVPSEMMAEKVRALAQRLKHPDLADSGFMLLKTPDRIDDDDVQAIVSRKFDLIRGGDVLERIMTNLDALGAGYDERHEIIAPVDRLALSRSEVRGSLRGLRSCRRSCVPPEELDLFCFQRYLR
jgi:hypothetical protein